MKRQIFTLLIIGIVFIPSCKEKQKRASCIWTGQEYIGNQVPACIIWYKKVPPPTDAWKPYKAFSQIDANDMRNIILHLMRPEIKESNPNIKTTDKLSLIFYNGFPKALAVREVYFEIKDKTFIGPSGKSDKIAEILLGRQEVRSLFYYPYSDLGASHYWDDFERILKINESNRSHAIEQKMKKEAKKVD